MARVRRQESGSRASGCKQCTSEHEARRTETEVVKVKYIVVTSASGIPAAILFNELLTHKDVAGSQTVCGAGFCNPAGAVWGRSDSLGIKSSAEDATYVKHAIAFTLQLTCDTIKP